MPEYFMTPSLSYSQGREPFKKSCRDLERFRKFFHALWWVVVGRSLLSWEKKGAILPDVEVFKSEKGILIRSNLPGLKEKDINIPISNGTFSLRDQKKEGREESRNYYRISERASGYFNSSFQLPSVIEGNKIEASLKDGVLKVTSLRY